MFRYIIQDGKMNEIMELLSNVLDMRVTFFDLQECEINGFNVKEMSLFCILHRKDDKFKNKCITCDKKHLAQAKKNKNVHIYHCHAGLWEGIVPLYDPHGIYLGSIVFGQLMDKNKNYQIKEHKESLKLLNTSSIMEMKNAGKLLKYLGEYIIENEIIKHKNKNWVDFINDYINDNLSKKITLSILSNLINRSTSFLSHNFPNEFGMTLKEYVCKKKMSCALTLLESGLSLNVIASKLGYYDEFHFSKAFKSYYGCSPKRYKIKI